MSLLKRVKHMSRTRFLPPQKHYKTQMCCICISNTHTWTTTLHFLPVSANRPPTDYSWLRVLWPVGQDTSLLHLASLHRPPVHFRIHRKIRVIASRAIHGQTPAYISDLLNPGAARGSPRPSEQGLPPVLRTSLENKRSLWSSGPLDYGCAASWSESCGLKILNAAKKNTSFQTGISLAML